VKFAYRKSQGLLVVKLTKAPLTENWGIISSAFNKMEMPYLKREQKLSIFLIHLHP